LGVLGALWVLYAPVVHTSQASPLETSEASPVVSPLTESPFGCLGRIVGPVCPCGSHEPSESARDERSESYIKPFDGIALWVSWVHCGPLYAPVVHTSQASPLETSEASLIPGVGFGSLSLWVTYFAPTIPFFFCSLPLPTLRPLRGKVLVPSAFPMAVFSLSHGGLQPFPWRPSAFPMAAFSLSRSSRRGLTVRQDWKRLRGAGSGSFKAPDDRTQGLEPGRPPAPIIKVVQLVKDWQAVRTGIVEENQTKQSGTVHNKVRTESTPLGEM
jgi:hypothetical protein